MTTSMQAGVFSSVCNIFADAFIFPNGMLMICLRFFDKERKVLLYSFQYTKDTKRD